MRLFLTKSRLSRSLVLCAVIATHTARLGAGTWTPLSRQAPNGISTMILLSDGTVLGQNSSTLEQWFRLTPAADGSYVNGSWSSISSMHDTRYAYGSAVLRDGRLFVAGGEHGSGGSTAEVYDPATDTWTLTPRAGALILDSVCKILPDGNILVAPVGVANGTLIYNSSANTWSSGPTCFGSQDEVSWVKLPDDSILTIDQPTTNSERYIPSLNKWIRDASLPVQLWSSDWELGAGFLLPNGKAFFIGANGNTALYTPSGNTNNGSWVAGPTTPGMAGAPDAPAAWMVNGKILCMLEPPGSSSSIFCEYDPVSNSFSSIDSPGGFAQPLSARMLDLPNGTVLYTHSANQLLVYDPGGAPLASAKPTISNLTTNADGSYHLTGTLFNGISEGAAYGDDAQMDSNFPLVRLTDSAGNVYYAKTYNWSRTSVMTGNQPVSTEFTVPQEVPSGQYNLAVVVNGVSSGTIPFFSGSLRITPGTNLISSGPVAGPFTLSTQTFILTNSGASSLNWSLGNASAWLNVSQASGTLSPGGPAASISVSLNVGASNLVAGTYSTVLLFTNLSEGRIQSRRISLSVVVPGQPVAATGYNAGLIVPANATGGDTAPYLTAGFGGFGFYAAGLNAVNYSGGSSTNEGLPASGTFTSAFDGATSFQFATYGSSNNAFLLSPAQGFSSSGTLTLNNPKPYKSISILAASANGYSAGDGQANLVIHFTNGNSSFSIPFNAQDWFQPFPKNVGIAHFGRIYRGNYGVFRADNPLDSNPNLYHTKIDLLSLGLATQSIASISFDMPLDYQNQSEDTAIFAISGSPTGIGPPPVFQPIKRTNSTITLTWSTAPGVKYFIQYKTNLDEPSWRDLSLASVATNSSMTLSDTLISNQSRFYRAVLSP